MSNFVRIEGLCRHFEMGDQVVWALAGIDLTIERGELLCVMGPSGSGKSTLLNLLGGLDRPSSGQIIVEGRDITTLDENSLAIYRREMVGFVFQSFNLVSTMTALQNVEFPMIFAGTPPLQRRERAHEALGRVGLGHRVEHRPTELSGGEQQRVALARSLVNQPAMLLADEPTGNLDTKTGAEIMELLAALNSEGRTVIAVTHDPRIMDYASRAIHMLDGRLVPEDAAPV
jgi:putative ABC transport system ATP-binding protein